jgi:hypothetical protein
MKLWEKVEMLFAHLKRILSLGRVRLRGPRGANDEFLLAATAPNLRKLAKIFPAPQQARKSLTGKALAPHLEQTFLRSQTLVFRQNRLESIIRWGVHRKQLFSFCSFDAPGVAACSGRSGEAYFELHFPTTLRHPLEVTFS